MGTILSLFPKLRRRIVMKKIIALFSALVVFASSSVFAACPLKVKNSECLNMPRKVAIAQPCCQNIQPRCGCKAIKKNPCTGKAERHFMGRTLDTGKSVYSNTIGNWYDASFGALYNAYID